MSELGKILYETHLKSIALLGIDSYKVKKWEELDEIPKATRTKTAENYRYWTLYGEHRE